MAEEPILFDAEFRDQQVVDFGCRRRRPENPFFGTALVYAVRPIVTWIAADRV